MIHENYPAIFAESLRRMATWYDEHPSPGTITPLDAIQMSLRDTAVAAERAAQGHVWFAPNEYVVWNPKRQSS